MRVTKPVGSGSVQESRTTEGDSPVHDTELVSREVPE
jgi:hypothetical protein